MTQPARQRFDIVTNGSGDFVDTGAPMAGEIAMMRFDIGDLDTGTDLLIEAVSSGMVIGHFENVGASWTRAPGIGVFDTGGDAVSGEVRAPVLAHDRLRLTVS